MRAAPVLAAGLAMFTGSAEAKAEAETEAWAGVRDFDIQERCGSGFEEPSALSLRQLRSSPTRLPAEGPDTEVHRHGLRRATLLEEAGPESDGLPGGWGEAEQYARSHYLGPAAEGSASGGQAWHEDILNGTRNLTMVPSLSGPGPAPLRLFHQTGPKAGPLILRYGFRPGTQGWCGPGIYFAQSPQETQTKAIGPESSKGFMIEALVNVGKVRHMPQICDRYLNGGIVQHQGFDSVSFNPGDGVEYVVYSSARILSARRI